MLIFELPCLNLYCTCNLIYIIVLPLSVLAVLLASASLIALGVGAAGGGTAGEEMGGGGGATPDDGNSFLKNNSRLLCN